MADGYLIALVRDSTRLRPEEETVTTQDHPVVAVPTAVLSEKLTNYLTYDVAPLPVTPPPLSLPREDKLLVPPPYKSDGWWRQSWPDSVTETAARSSEEDEEDEEDEELFFYQDEQSPPTFIPPSLPRRPALVAAPPPPRAPFSSSPPAEDLSRGAVSPQPLFTGADELRLLANAIYLLSKWFCPNCSLSDPVTRETVSAETETRVARLDWDLIADTLADGGPLTLGTALPVVLAFVARLQRLESQRHGSTTSVTQPRSSHTPSFQGTFWTLCAALAFQTRLQRKVHQAESDGPLKRACGVGCCRCPGFALYERPPSEPKRRMIVSSLCSRLLPQSSSFSPVMQRDCSAALEIIQRFSVAVYIGSAWVEEQEPLSTCVIGGFLSTAFTAFMVDGKCRRISTSNAVLAGIASRGTQLKRIAAATATSLYMSIVPCVPSGGTPSSSANTSSAHVSCAICRLDNHHPKNHQHSPYKSHSTQRALGATHSDFERKLFAVIEFVECELRISGGELERVAEEALKILQCRSFDLTTSGNTFQSL